MPDRSISSTSLLRHLGAWRAGGEGIAYRRLADALRLLVLDGRLPLDVRLPGERDLAVALGVSRTTVASAYGRLREQGYLSSRRGSGSRTGLPGGAPDRPADPFGDRPDADAIDLVRAALPAGAAVHGAYTAALAALPAHLPGHGYEPVGLPALREALAERYSRRGLPTTAAQILVTNGAQHAFALVLALLTGPGDRVVLDHPTYPHAIDAVQRASCRVVPVALPAGGGWDADALLAALRQTGPRLAYLVPDFHNPTGRCMDVATRRAVAAAAAKTQTTLVIDETLADLWIDAPPPGPAVLHQGGGAVISLGSAAKSFWGGLRVGWIRAQEGTIAALAGVRTSLDLGTAVLEQLATAALLADEAPYLRARRRLLAGRRDHLLALVAEHLPAWETRSVPGGLSLWAQLPGPLSTALAASAARHGVLLAAGPRFGVDGTLDRHMRLPFTRPDGELTLAITRLARADAELTPAGRGALSGTVARPATLAVV